MMRLMRSVLCGSAVAMATIAVALCQQGTTQKTRSTLAQSESSVSKSDGKKPDLKLISLDPIDPKALAQTIRLKTNAITSKVANKPSTGATDSGVTEFYAAPQTAKTAGDSLVLFSGGSKKSTLKNIHGDVSGALVPETGEATDAAAGTSSKSGKTYIYVETDHVKGSSPH